MMMCKNPYIKQPVGISRLDTILSDEARLASTPFPCGQCMHCRINKSREWKHRIMLESLSHVENCFVTLTYNDENLPEDGSVNPAEVTKFLKRLRKVIYPMKVRYFIVGEYGETSWRPHYHACLFGVSDQSCIDEAWGKGFSSVGELTPASSAYTCGYILKGMTSKKDERIQERNLHPEFMRVSKMDPGGLGIEALKEIAENLKRQKFGKDQAIRTLRYGKQELPLGRYLTNKLIDFAELDANIWECDFYDHVEGIFEKHLGNGTPFKDSIVSEHESERKAREYNNHIFRRRRKL